VGIDQMRGAIALAAGTLAASPAAITRDHIVMAYTFKTQTMKSAAVQLAALPYSAPATTVAPVPGTTKVYCSAAVTNSGCTGAPTIVEAFQAYGVDSTAVPLADIGYIIETVVPTFNKLRCNAGDPNCSDTGAFGGGANAAPVVEPIKVLIALPVTGASGCVPNQPSAGSVCTVPLVIFRHGLGGGRVQMLGIADRLNKAGIAVAAIDAPKHGDRSYCSADNQCAGGATCVPDPALVNEGDAPNPSPGHCMNGAAAGDFVRIGCATCTNASALPAASGNFLISGNLFRTRDTLRQDIIDESQLIRVLSPDPTGAQLANLIFTSALRFQIDPTQIWFVGQSLGAISGTVDVAANPRITKAALNVGGSTIVDVFSNSPNLTPGLNALLASLGIATGTPAYLQFINVAKWVLDPADPENFAQNLIASPLASPLSGNVAPPGRAILGQYALCDGTVPNPFNLNLYQLTGLSGAGSTGTITTFFKGATTTPSCPTNAMAHGFLLDWATNLQAATSVTLLAQDDIAAFFLAGTLPPTARFAP
jgi:hypothetical protein